MLKSSLFIIAGCLVVFAVQLKVPQKRLKDSIVFGFNDDIISYSPDFLRLTSFGYGKAVSSMLWLRFLQQTPPEKVARDQLSWIYYDLEAVSELDPNFYPAYELGGIFLSVITEDKRGAERIFLKGTKRFPNSWRLRAYLAYHYQFELGEPEKAGEQYVAAAALPGASYLVKVLASSSLAKRQGNEAAIDLLRGFLVNTKDEAARSRILEKIRKLQGK